MGFSSGHCLGSQISRMFNLPGEPPVGLGRVAGVLVQ